MPGRHRSSILRDSPPPPRRCDHPDCAEAGVYRAPKSREQLRDYYWFCLDHVREYNKSWNFCAGMSDAEMERMVRLDTVWQRPSWPMGGWRAHEQRLRERIYRDFAMGAGLGGDASRGEEDGAAPRRAPRTEEDRALAVLDLAAPVDFTTVKARYRALVKRHHPDANGGSREAEERLKTINQAYGILKASFAS